MYVGPLGTFFKYGMKGSCFWQEVPNLNMKKEGKKEGEGDTN